MINNVHSFEARYDTLYIRIVNGLGVYNSRFDRAGRNVVSIVGNTDNFEFANCYIGSLWGLEVWVVMETRGVKASPQGAS